jgi:hypothetical protein
MTARVSFMKEDKFFRLSKPYGYYIPEVNEAIKKYNEVISKLKDNIMNYKIREKKYTERIKILEEEVGSMHMQMSMLSLPDMDDKQEYNSLLKLAKSKNTNTEDIAVEEASTKEEESVLNNTEALIKSQKESTDEDDSKYKPIQKFDKNMICSDDSEDGDAVIDFSH